MKQARKVDDKIKDVKTYHEQVEIFAVDTPLSYIAFDILKVCIFLLSFIYAIFLWMINLI